MPWEGQYSQLGYWPKQREGGSQNPDEGAYTFQVAVNKIGIMKICQSFSDVHELRGYQQVTKEYAIMTYKLKVIASVMADVLHNIAVGHPFVDHREPPILEGVGNANKTEDVGMGQILPYGYFLTEVLHGV